MDNETKEFHEYLDQLYGELRIEGVKYGASMILKNLDLPLYEQILRDWRVDHRPT